MKKEFLLLFCVLYAVVFVAGVMAEAIPVADYYGEIDVDVGKDATLIVGPEPEVIVVEPVPECVNGTKKCSVQNYVVCENNAWVDKGLIDGKCGYSSGGGGGGGGNGGNNRNGVGASDANADKCVELWKCSNWSECEEGKKTRTCKDTAKCGTFLFKPKEEASCDETVLNEVSKSVSESSEKAGLLESVMSAVKSFSNSKAAIAVALLALLVIVSVIVGMTKGTAGNAESAANASKESKKVN